MCLLLLLLCRVYTHTKSTGQQQKEEQGLCTSINRANGACGANRFLRSIKHRFWCCWPISFVYTIRDGQLSHPTRKTTSFLQGVVSLFIFTLCWTRVLPNLKVIRRKYKSSRGVFGKGGRFGNLNRRFPLICDCYYLTSRDFSPPNCV